MLFAPRVRPEFLVRRWHPKENAPISAAPAAAISVPLRLAKKDEVNRRAKEQLAGEGFAVSGCFLGINFSLCQMHLPDKTSGSLCILPWFSTCELAVFLFL